MRDKRISLPSEFTPIIDELKARWNSDTDTATVQKALQLAKSSDTTKESQGTSEVHPEEPHPLKDENPQPKTEEVKRYYVIA
jgi:hypothetical protein